MMDSQVKRCECVNLQTGCTVIGTIDLIMSVVLIAMGKFRWLLLTICSMLLIIGARKRNFNWMWPWLIDAVLMIAYWGYFLLLIVFNLNDEHKQILINEVIDVTDSLLVWMSIILILIDIYEIYIVLGFKKQIIQQSIFNTMRA